LGSAVWLIVYVIGYFSAVLHLALVPHAVCEHGDLVHVRSACMASADALDRSADRASHPSLLDPSPRSNALEPVHEHCSIVVPLSRSGSDIGHPSAVIWAWDFATPLPSRQHGAPQNFPLYLLAPHHSPPVIG